jgi:CheY-like chemotaxis protein
MGSDAKKRILVVEDDQYIRDSLAELLQDEGYAVDVAKDGQEGLDYLQREDAPDLILLDLMMPIKDGFQFRAEQRQDPRLAKIPVVIFSADTGVNQPNAQFEGAAILKKPVDLDALLSMVRQSTESH